VLALGAIEQKTRRPLASILQRLARGRVDAQRLKNPYSALAQEIRYRRVAAKSRKSLQRGSGLSSVFGGLFARKDERPAA
jgi:hypothetical protein